MYGIWDTDSPKKHFQKKLAGERGCGKWDWEGRERGSSGDSLGPRGLGGST